MAESTLISGKRGEGKSKAAVRKMRDYLKAGRIVATNMDLFVEHMLPSWRKDLAFRLPDFPTAEDFAALPLGNPNPVEEHMNGLLVLDECAVFLNSRDWQAKDRQKLISWLAQSRKFGWDLMLIAQHPRMIDAQVREALCELSASAKRMDKIAVPLISPIWKWLFGKPLRMPKMHVITFRYGFQPQAPKADTWVFSGDDLDDCYDTLQVFNRDNQYQGVSCYLPPWHLKGRYMKRWEMYQGVALGAFMLGALLAGVGGYFAGSLKLKSESAAAVSVVDSSAQVIGTVEGSAVGQMILSDGRVLPFSSVKADPEGLVYESSGKFFRGKK